MPMTMTREDVAAKFSDVLAFVSKDQGTVTILEMGLPVARVVPVSTYRSVRNDPKYSFKIKDEDLFSDDGDMCEVFNEKVTPA